jgi:shikimate kinase
MKKNLVLIGYRGAGKTVVGAVLAAEMGWPLVSLDQAIVERAGTTIPDLVESYGWTHFRALEHEEVLRAMRLEGHIIDCGGGVVEDPRSVAALREHGFCVLLTATVPTIAARIGGDANRPSLTGKSIVEEIEEKLAQRGPLYASAADLTLATDAASPKEIARQILAALPAGLWPGA